MPFYIFARFDPKPGAESEVRDILTQVVAPTRAEAGCRSIHIFETVREPTTFFIHSEWEDEAAFEHHCTLPHTEQMVAQAEPLVTNHIVAGRTRQIA